MKYLLTLLFIISISCYGQTKIDTTTFTNLSTTKAVGDATTKLVLTSSSVWSITYDTTKGWIRYVGFPKLDGFNVYANISDYDEATAPRYYFRKAVRILKKEWVRTSIFKIILFDPETGIYKHEFDLTKRYEFIPDSEIVK